MTSPSTSPAPPSYTRGGTTANRGQPIDALRDRVTGRRTRAHGADAEGAHRLGQVFNETVTQVFDLSIDAGRQFVRHVCSDDDLARQGECGQARCHIDPTSVDVGGVDHHLAEVNAQPKTEPVHSSCSALDRKRRSHCRRCALELQQHPIPQTLHHPPSMLGQDLGAHLVHEAPPAVDEPGFVFLHQPHRLDHVHHHDGAAGPGQFGQRPRIGRWWSLTWWGCFLLLCILILVDARAGMQGRLGSAQTLLADE